MSGPGPLATAGPREQTVTFGGIEIDYDDRVLEPRAWTQAQSRWAADLTRSAPDGPVLELCCGAGQIGLLAVARSERHLVCVDADATAAAYARANAERAGMGERVEVRHARLEEALDAEERFAVVVADPPWVTSSEIGTFPDDPRTAIDGGPRGLDVARACLAVIGAHLAEAGSAVLQVGTADQVDDLAPDAVRAGLRVVETRRHGTRGVLALLQHG